MIQQVYNTHLITIMVTHHACDILIFLGFFEVWDLNLCSLVN